MTMMIIIIIIIVAQDIEVLNLQGKIDAMTKEREQISKESGQIMDEVCIKMIMTTIIIIMMTIRVKKIESLILHIAFSFPQQTIIDLKKSNKFNLEYEVNRCYSDKGIVIGFLLSKNWVRITVCATSLSKLFYAQCGESHAYCKIAWTTSNCWLKTSLKLGGTRKISALCLSKLFNTQSGECLRRLQNCIRQPVIAD